MIKQLNMLYILLLSVKFVYKSSIVCQHNYPYFGVRETSVLFRRCSFIAKPSIPFPDFKEFGGTRCDVLCT